MKHLVYTTKFNYFYLLTAEEQLEDIRDYFFNVYKNFDDDDISDMMEMLGRPSRNIDELQSEYKRISEIFDTGTTEILTNAQQKELEQNDSVVALIPESAIKVFSRWLRTNRLHFTIVAIHSIVDGFECVIHKDRYFKM